MSKKDDTFKVDINKLNVNFGLPDHPKKDDKLIELFSKADKKEIPVYADMIPMDKIKPFCNFVPKKEILDNIRKKYLQYFLDDEPQSLHVYPEGDNFIMSDDYYAYYVYLEAKFEKAPCLIFGETGNPVVYNKERVDWKM